MLPLLAGCSPTLVWTPLVAPEAWELVGADEDPFADRPVSPVCPGGFHAEGEVFEVETDLCSYGTFAQPLLRDVSEARELEILFWHLALWAPEPTEGHAAVALSDVLLFEQVLAIPGEAEVYTEYVAAPRELTAGEPVFVHIHNHGTNSYRLGALKGLLPE